MKFKQTNARFALFFGIAVFATSFYTAEAAIDAKKSEAFFESAIEELHADKINAAVIQLRNALQQNPQNLPARIKLGEILLREDQPLAAIKELETAQSMGGDENLILVPLARAFLTIGKPEQVITGIVPQRVGPEVEAEIKLLQADAYIQLGSSKEAENLYLEASSILPTDPRPMLGVSRIEMAKGRVKQASQLIEQALALAPDNYHVLLFKATAHRDLGQYELAAQAFARVLELEPGSVRALTARAAMWIDLGRVEDAKKDLEIASNFNNDSLETLYLRSVLLFGEGKQEEARELLRDSANEIRSISEGYRAKIPNTLLMLGVVAFFDQNYDGAITYLKQFLAKIPKHPGAKRYLASSYLAKQEWNNIVKLLVPKAGEQLLDPFALSILGEAYRASGDFRAAERYFDQAMQIAPGVAGIGIRLAENRLDAGRPEKAIDELNELIERFPDMFEAHAQLLRVHVKTGNRDAAERGAEKLVSDFPEVARAHTIVSGVYMMLGQLDKARRSLEQAVLIDPEAALPKLNLARIARAEGHVDTAEAQYRATLEQFPTFLDAELELMELLFERREAEELKTRLQSVLGRHPKNTKAQKLELSLLLATEQDINKVREKLQTLAQAFPENAELALTIGDGYRTIGDLEDAKLFYRRAVEHGQFDSDLLFPAANRQVSIKDHNGALWTLTKAAQASPDDIQIAILQAAVLTLLNDLERARDKIDSAYKRHGQQAEIALVEGDYFMHQKMHSEAITAYQLAWELKPAPKTVQTLFRTLVAAGRLPEAEQLLTPWIKKYPQDIVARRLYAELLTSQQRWSPAKDEWESLQKDGYEDLQVLNNLAAIYQRLSDPRALPAAEVLYERAPDNPAVLDTYGWILTQNGRIEEGLAILREAYARASTQPVIRYHIGKALASLGRVDEAREEVEAALDEDASFLDRDDANAFLESLTNN